MWIFLCPVCLPLMMFHALPLIDSVWRGTKPAFPSFLYQLASFWMWSMGGADGRLKGGRKGEAGVFLPPPSLGKISRAAPSLPWHQPPAGMSTVVWVQLLSPAPQLEECHLLPFSLQPRLPAAPSWGDPLDGLITSCVVSPIFHLFCSHFLVLDSLCFKYLESFCFLVGLWLLQWVKHTCLNAQHLIFQWTIRQGIRWKERE